MGKPTGATAAAGTYSWSASYDRDGRQTSGALVRSSEGDGVERSADL